MPYERKDDFHILGPKARGVQLTFFISEDLKPEKNVLQSMNIKFNIKLTTSDFGDYILKILYKNTELYQLCNLLGFNSEEILGFISKLNSVMIDTIKSGLDLNDLEDLQVLKKNESINLIRKEITDNLLSVIDDEIDRLKNKIFIR